MVATFALLSNLSLASAALADTSSQPEARHRKSHQPRTIAQPQMNRSDFAGALWAAAMKPGNEANFITITGTFIVPHLQNDYYDSKSGVTLVFVIDRDQQCENDAGFQAGLDMKICNGVHSYIPWCMWPPTNLACNFTGLDIQANDDVTITLNASSRTTVMVIFENRRGRQISVEQVVAPPEYALCGKSAGWGIQPMKAPILLANFGILVITNAIASGDPYIGSFTPMDIYIVNMVVNYSFLTNVFTAESSLAIQYLPPSRSE